MAFIRGQKRFIPESDAEDCAISFPERVKARQLGGVAAGFLTLLPYQNLKCLGESQLIQNLIEARFWKIICFWKYGLLGKNHSG